MRIANITNPLWLDRRLQIPTNGVYLDLSLVIWPATSNDDPRVAKLAQALKEEAD